MYRTLAVYLVQCVGTCNCFFTLKNNNPAKDIVYFLIINALSYLVDINNIHSTVYSSLILKNNTGTASTTVLLVYYSTC